MKPTATQTKGIRCISYARFSDDRQKQGTSIERQLDMAKEFVARNKSKGFWLDNESIVDKSRSGAKGENLDPTTGALGRFIQAAKAGKYPRGSYLIIEKLDRLSRRDPKLVNTLLAEIIDDCGINIAVLSPVEKIYTSSSSNDFNITTYLYLQIELAIAHEYSNTLSKRIKYAQDRKRDQLRNLNKENIRLPSWLKYDSSKTNILVDTKKAETILFIFNSVKNGKTQSQIIRSLIADHKPISTPTNRTGNKPNWNSSYLSSLISDRRLIGELQPYRVVYKDGEGQYSKQIRQRIPDGSPVQHFFPSVVPEELFYEVQGVKAQQRKTRRIEKYKTTNLLRGIVFSGYTDNPLHLHTTLIKRRNGETYRTTRLYDYGREKGQDVCRWSVDYNAVENLVLMALNEIDERNFADQLTPINKRKEEIATELANHQHYLSDLELKATLDNVTPDQAIFFSKIYSSRKSKLDELRKELEQIGTLDDNQQRKDLSQIKDLTDLLNSDEKLLDERRSQLQRMIPSIVRRVEIIPRKIGRRTISMGLISLMNNDKRLFFQFNCSMPDGITKILHLDNGDPVLFTTKYGVVQWMREKKNKPSKLEVKISCIAENDEQQELVRLAYTAEPLTPTEIQKNTLELFKQSKLWRPIDMNKFFGKNN